MNYRRALSTLLAGLAFSGAVAAQEVVLVEDADARLAKQAVLDPKLYELENLATQESLKTKRFLREGKTQIFVQAPQIHYDEGSAHFHPKENKRLQRVANLVKGQPFRVIVSGYSDTSDVEGSAFYDSVSDDRALEVAKYLMQQGVEPGKLTVVGRGPADPVADNSTSEGRAKNRRVEIVVFSDL